MKKFNYILSNFENALARLSEAVKETKTELEKDGVIQRFEFTFELSWKLMKVYLENQGIICDSPKSCLKGAFEVRLIDDEKNWLKMLEDRNLSVHIYNKKTAVEIFKRIKKYYVREFKSLLEKIKKI